MVFSHDNLKDLKSQVFTYANDSNKPQIILLCKSNRTLPKELIERVAKKVAENLNNGDSQQQIQCKVVEQEDGKFDISYDNTHQIVELKDEVSLSPVTNKVKEVSLKNLESKLKNEKKLSRFFNRFVEIVTSPLTWVERSVSKEQKEITKEVKDAARVLGKIDQRNICAQLSLVNKSLGNQNPELKDAQKNGLDMLKAAEKASAGNKKKDPVKALAAGYINKVKTTNQSLVLPYAIQNAHILVLKQENGSFILEDRCLAQQDKKIPLKTTYKFATEEQAQEFLNQLISSLKTPKIPYESVLRFFVSDKKTKEIDEVRQSLARDPIEDLLKANGAEKVHTEPAPSDLVSSSDDPLKMIYEFINDLKDSHAEGKLNKVAFYRDYTQYLSTLYNNNSERLSTIEKIQLLEGLSQIADKQLLNALSKELGPVAADQVVSSFKEWIADKRKNLKATQKTEDTRETALKSESKPAVVNLSTPLDAVTGEQEGMKSVHAHVDPALLIEIRQLDNPNISMEAALQIIRKMDGEVDHLISEGKLSEARLLSMTTLRAVPSLDHRVWNNFELQKNFEQRNDCIRSLSNLAYHFSECVALSGISMQPHEVFEIQINMPIVIRMLISRQCEVAQAEYLLSGIRGLKGVEESKVGWVILATLGGGASRLKTNLNMQDSSLMIGGDPKMQARYNAAKERYDILASSKEQAPEAAYKFVELAKEKNPNLTNSESSAILAQFEGAKNRGALNSLVPKEWTALMAAEALGWVVAAPGELLISQTTPEENKIAFVQHMARASRLEIAQASPETQGLALVDTQGKMNIGIRSNVPDEVLHKAAEEARQSRKHLLGALQPRIMQAKVNDQKDAAGMSEPSALREAHLNGGKIDPQILFKMLEAGANTVDSEGKQQFSHFSVINCFEVILQFPYVLDDPAVQDRLLQVLSDRNVLSTFLQNNPQFIVRIAPVLERMITQKLDGNKDLAGALFLMDLAQRLYQSAKQSQINEIIAAVKPYGIDNGLEKVAALFEQSKEPSEKNQLAGYLVRFYSDKAPESLDVQAWKQLLVARAIVQSSPSESGHPAIILLAMQKLQETHLPYLVTTRGSIKDVLNLLVNKPNAEWTSEKAYRYELKDAKPTFIVDLQTGQGYNPASGAGQRVILPQPIINSKLLRQVLPALSGQNDIQAVKRIVGPDTIYEFEFDKKTFKAIQTSGEDTIKLIQVMRGQDYAFVIPNIHHPKESNIGSLISEKGLWINTKNSNDILVPARGIHLNENAYHVVLKNQNIKEVFVNVGDQKKVVCADDMSQEFAKVIACRPREGMIYLKPPDSKTIDEIRFPEGLEVVNKDGIWKIKGNEMFEWQVNDIGDLEARFGKSHAQLMMAFKNPVTGEQIIWMWPQKVSSTGKRGAEFLSIENKNVPPILVAKAGHKETTNEAGLLYLSYLAYKQGNYALAAEYLNKTEDLDGKPFVLPQDKDQLNALKQVVELVVDKTPATTAQKTLQLKMILTVMQILDKKIPLSAQAALMENIPANDVAEMKQQYDRLAPSQIQSLKKEGIVLSNTNLKTYANLAEKPSQEQKIRSIDRNKDQKMEPKSVSKVKVETPQAPAWGNFFRDLSRENLQAEVMKCVKFFPVNDQMPALQRAKNEALRKGIEEAAYEKAGKNNEGFKELDPSKLKEMKEQLIQRRTAAKSEIETEHRFILASARHYAEELDLSSLIAGKTLDDDKLMSIMLDKYQDGELDVLPNEVRTNLEERITRFLINSTELQQLKKGEEIFDRLMTMYSKNPETVNNLDWALQSKELYRCMNEGSDYTRHSDNEGNIDIKGRRYLVTEYRSELITRQKAKEAIEAMLDSPEKFVKVRMGLGKSTFIFPHLARFLIDKGKLPVVMFTEELLQQSRAFMDPKAYIFEFDRNYGIDPIEAEHLKNDLKMTDDAIEIRHLTKLYESLASLRGDGRYPITTPQRRAALHNKKFELLRMKNAALKREDFEQARIIQGKLELVKKIDGIFKQPGVRELHDEDVNLDISTDFDYALEDSAKMDTVNLATADYLMQTIFTSGDPEIIKLKQKILSQTLSSMPVDQFQESMAALAKIAIENFESASHPKPNAAWISQLKAVNPQQMINYMIGTRKEMPEGFPPFTDSPECKRLAAMKTYLSKTLPNLYKAQDQIDRGISESNGCVVVPFVDGKERAGNRYGDSKEALMHAFLYYASSGCAEEFFDSQLRELKWSDKPEWKDFATKLEQLRLEHKLDKPYAAFLLPEAASLRLQLLNRLINETSYFNINKTKINCNSQDIIKGNEVNVASGTGDAFSLNLAESGQEVQSAAIEGETYLKMGLNEKADEFKDPLEYIKSQVQEASCHGIMIQGYSTGNKTPALVSELRKTAPERHFVFADATNSNTLMMWLPGADKPVPYLRSRINLDLALNIYPAVGTRGIDFPMKRSPDAYVVNMIGPGSKEEAANQSAWRARHLGSGQKLRVAFHSSMVERIRKNNGTEDKLHEPILAGHVINDVVIESLKDVGNARMKAVIFEARSHIKQFAEEELSRSLSPNEMDWENNNIPLGAQVENAMFDVYQSLYIVTIDEDWESQYGQTKEQNPALFYGRLQQSELRRVEALNMECLFKMAELLVGNEERELLMIMRSMDLKQPVAKQGIIDYYKANGKENLTEEQVNKIYEKLVETHALLVYLREVGKLTPPVTPDKLEAREAINGINIPSLKLQLNPGKEDALLNALIKFNGVMQANKKADDLLMNAWKQVKDPAFIKSLNQNLPSRIDAKPNLNQNSQVQVQQQQQKQQMQVQQQQQQQMQQQSLGAAPAAPYEPPKALVLGSFISGLQQGNFPRDLKGELATKIPTHYKSPRAKALLDQNIANTGAPMVYRLVVQDEAGKVLGTCLITPSDYTESVGKDLEELRKQNPSVRLGVYPLTKGQPPLPAYDGTNQVPLENESFVRAAAWDKLLIGWTEFTDAERKFLEYAIPNLDDTYWYKFDSADEGKLKEVQDEVKLTNLKYRADDFSNAINFLPFFDNRRGRGEFEKEELMSELDHLELTSQVSFAGFNSQLEGILRLPPADKKEALAKFRTKVEEFVAAVESGEADRLHFKTRQLLIDNPALKNPEQEKELQKLLEFKSCRRLAQEMFAKRFLKFVDDLQNNISYREIFDENNLWRREIGIVHAR